MGSSCASSPISQSDISSESHSSQNSSKRMTNSTHTTNEMNKIGIRSRQLKKWFNTLLYKEFINQGYSRLSGINQHRLIRLRAQLA